MGLLGKLWVKLGLDSSEYQKGAKDAQNTTESFGDKIKGMAVKAAAAISALALLKKAFNFGKEAYNTAAQAEGVERAFARLNNPNLLNELRAATQGTVSDLELMQNAIQAKNFKIPLDNLATYLKFASTRAKETGQSVDYLVQSIVLGVGRKSPLILDNLGISALEVREEFAKTGDMAKAVANIIDREMGGDANDTVVGSKEKIGQASAAWKNALVEFGKIGPIKTMGDWFKNTSAEIANFITQASIAAKSPNLNGWQSFWAFINPEYAKQIQSEQAIVDLKEKQAKIGMDNRYWSLFSQGASYSAEAIEKALERIKNKEIDVSKEYWYDPIEAANFTSSLESQLKVMREQEAEAKKQQEIREKSRQGLREQMKELEELAELETDPKKLASLDAQISKLKARLEVVKDTKNEFKKGSIGDLEYQKSELEKKVKLTVDDKDRQNLLKDISDIDALIELKLNVSKSERQTIEDKIKEIGDKQLAIPLSIDTKEAQKQFDALQKEQDEYQKVLDKAPKNYAIGSETDLSNKIADQEKLLKTLNLTAEQYAGIKANIDKLKISMDALPQNAFPVGSLAEYDKKIADIESGMNLLTGSTLEAAQASVELLKLQKEIAANGAKPEARGKLGENIKAARENIAKLRVELASASNAGRDTIGAAIEAGERQIALWGDMESAAETLAEAIGSTVTTAIAELASVLGDSGGWNIGGFTARLLDPLGDAAIQAGLLTMGIGTALEALKTAFSNLFGGGPAGAIASGAALLALGVAAKAGAAAITKGQRNASGGANPNTFTGGYSNSGSSTRTAQSLQLVSPQSQTIVVKGEVSGDKLRFVLDKDAMRRKS